MKVNYDPKYTTPYQVRAMDSYTLAQEAYGPGKSCTSNAQARIFQAPPKPGN